MVRMQNSSKLLGLAFGVFVALIAIAFSFCQVSVACAAEPLSESLNSDSDATVVAALSDEGADGTAVQSLTAQAEAQAEAAQELDAMAVVGSQEASGSYTANIMSVVDTSADEDLQAQSTDSCESVMKSMIDTYTTYLKLKDYGFTVQQVVDAFNAITDDPEYFFLKKSINYSYIKNSTEAADCTITQVHVYYYFDSDSERDTARAKLESVVKTALTWVSDSMSTVQKVQCMHDYLVRNVAYDDSSSTMQYTAYGALVEGKAVCEGYALAFKLLLQRLDISSVLVASTSMNHAWNQVLINGTWYNVDVTWDDPLVRSSGSSVATDQGFSAAVSHTYFLKSDSSFKNASTAHYGWTSNYTCPKDYPNYTYSVYNCPVGQKLFTDVTDPSAWYYANVYKAANMGLIKGYSDGSFGPNKTLTRADAAVILWRYFDSTASSTDSKTVSNTTGLSDVASGVYYTAAANWAVENGIITGKSTSQGKRFDPSGPITREQLCVVVANAAKKFKGATISGGTSQLDSMPDAGSVSSWARASVAWGLSKGVITGSLVNGTRYVSPGADVTRAMMAVVLVNAIENGLL